MHDINAIVTKNFNDNIAYIEQHHPELFAKLSEYDAAVSNGHYKERYELVFENGNFDVFEPSTQKYLYNKNAQKHIKLSFENTNTKLDNNVFEGFIRSSYDDATAKFYKKEKNLNSHLNFTAEIINYIQKKQTATHTSIGKYIFFGVGLGLHITPITTRLNPSLLLIVEDDLELFRLSLFCVNYKKIAQSTNIIFSIFQSKEEFTQTTDDFLNTKFYLNHYIKYFELLSHNEEKNNLFYLRLTNQSHLRFLFHDTASTYIKPLKHFSNKNNVVQTSINISSLNMPFLLLCSGPSLQHKIEWVKQHQNNFIIVAVSSALSYLEKNNVKVDIITHLDPFEASMNSFKRISKISYFDDALKLFAITSPDEVLNLFQGNNLFVFEVGSSYQKNSIKLSSPCVGSWSLLMLLALQAKEIYLLGLDLALDTKTGKNHIDDHQDHQTLVLNDGIQQDTTLKYKESSLAIDGNLQEKVYTTPHFYSSIEIINRYFSKIKKGFQHIYNLSEGALLQVAKPTKTNEINPTKQNKEEVMNLLKKSLLSNSKSQLSTEDINELFKKLQHSKSLKDKIQSYKLQSPFNPEEYMQYLIDSVASKENLFIYELSRILEDYMKYISHYVYEFLISESSTQSTKELDTIFRYNIIKLIDIYIKALEAILQKDN